MDSSSSSSSAHAASAAAVTGAAEGGARGDSSTTTAMTAPGDSSAIATSGAGARRKKIVWECSECCRACFPIRSESRCLCGHRYRQHPSASGGFACGEKGCKCTSFFYIFAEGAFILRCRCKHKAQEHDAGAAPYACARAGCKCAAFDSPWVCNCDHPWAAHAQRVVDFDLSAPHPVGSSGEFQVLRTDLRVPLPRYGNGNGSGVVHR